MALIPPPNPRFQTLGPSPDEADQARRAKVGAFLLMEAAVLSPLQNTLLNQELLEEVLGCHQSQRPKVGLHLGGAALDHLLS